MSAARDGAAGAARPPFLHAEWRDLVMLNYDVAPGVLAPLVPAGTTLDLWQGRALVSVVGFRFLRTRVLGVPIPHHRDFTEVNLRFYVRREVGGEVRRGVVFVRELVPRLGVALVARLAYNEPYRAVPMRWSALGPPSADAPRRFVYEWRTGGVWQQVAATAVGAPAVPPPDSEATFVAEHYWGYTRQRDGSTVEYAVAHPPWRVRAAESPVLVAEVRSLYGAAFERALAAPPASAFVAEGSPVVVYRPRRLAAAAA